MAVGELGGAGGERRRLGDSLLEEQHRRLKHGFRFKSFLHRTVQKHIGQSKQAHALMVSHEGADHSAGLPAGQAGRGVVDCLIESVCSGKSFRCKPFEIQTCLFGRYRQGQCRGIRRNDQIIGEPAFETQAGHAEGAVLVVEMYIDRVVARFRKCPRARAR